MPDIIEQPKPAEPAAPPTPEPAPAPAPERDIALDQFAEFDKALKLADTPVQATAGKPPEPKPEAKPTPDKVQPTKEPVKPVTAQQGPKELRAELERLKGELKTATESKSQLEAKIKDAEAKGKDTAALTERLAQVEKERDQLKGDVSALKRDEDPEFIKQYKTPFNEASAYAQQVVEQLQITNEDGTARAGTFEDLSDLFHLGQSKVDAEGKLHVGAVGKAYAKARALFGDDYQVVMNHLNELWKLDKNYQSALHNERKTWQARQQEEQAKKVQQKQTWDTIREQVNKELAEKVDDYHDSPDDKELSEARAKGYELFDGTPKTQQEAALKFAHVRHRVAAFAPMKLKILRLEQALAAEKAKNTAAAESEPGKTKRSGGTATPAPEKSWEEAAREAMANA